MAAVEIERRRRTRARQLRSLDLGDFIPALSPELDRPDHLSPLLRVLERASAGEPVRVLVSTPPQHAKSLTIEHAIARDLLLNPGNFWGYITYSAEKARIESRQVRDFALRAGVELRADTRALSYWRTPQGGGLLATGIGGPITGQRALKRIVVDDAVKGSEDAESPVVRDSTYDWFQSSVVSRAHPDTSIIAVGTRWNYDDLFGRLSQQTHQGAPVWEVINLPAINAEGQALWPQRRPLVFLEQQRAGMTPYFWDALFMGRPITRDQAQFFDAATTAILERVARPPTETRRVDERCSQSPIVHSDEGVRRLRTVRVWAPPAPGRQYLVSLDTAEGTGGDASAGLVFDRGTGQHMATIWGQFRPSELASVAVQLAREYLNAEIAVERNNHGHAVLLAMGAGYSSIGQAGPYPNVFVDLDGKRGWLTSPTSRPLALDNLEQAHRQGHFKTDDRVLLGQMRTFVVGPSGKAQAQHGSKDDLVMTAAIGWSCICRQRPRPRDGTNLPIL